MKELRSDRKANTALGIGRHLELFEPLQGLVRSQESQSQVSFMYEIDNVTKVKMANSS